MNAIVSQLRDSDYVVLAGIAVFWIALFTIAASYTEKPLFLLLIPLFTVVSAATYACIRGLFGMNRTASERTPRESVARSWGQVRNR